MIDLNNLTDIDDENDILDELEDLFDNLSVYGPDSKQLYVMYGIYLKDIVSNPINIKGKLMQVSFNDSKSKHPVCRGKMQTFEHIITRESKYKGKRDFDRDRANKIHWIKPILENAGDPRIKYFEKLHDDVGNRQYYWFEEKKYIVILKEVKPDLLLVTAFSVDNLETLKFKTWYNLYEESK